jgi:hypothetical protein
MPSTDKKAESMSLKTMFLPFHDEDLFKQPEMQRSSLSRIRWTLFRRAFNGIPRRSAMA